ncbi:hypothetical protein F4777DRAFT_385104 [Nemania sp. FL0916]|nr:hypothetical protein F4777DRAFT_385104 [Nemania sp. FL0916]
MAIYDLGLMVGGRFHQYANSAGQVYYRDTVANTASYSIPPGFEDHPTDTWSKNLSKGWPQWNNNRTGRSILNDPNPPPPRTYLDDNSIMAAIAACQRVPESNEHIYQRPLGDILRFMFPRREGFDVAQDAPGDSNFPDFTTLMRTRPPGGLYHQNDYLLTESKKKGTPWGATEDQLLSHLQMNGNKSKNCYGMIQIGLLVRFYKYESGVFEKLADKKFHLVDDVDEVLQWGQWLKANPMPFINLQIHTHETVWPVSQV